MSPFTTTSFGGYNPQPNTNLSFTEFTENNVVDSTTFDHNSMRPSSMETMADSGALSPVVSSGIGSGVFGANRGIGEVGRSAGPGGGGGTNRAGVGGSLCDVQASEVLIKQEPQTCFDMDTLQTTTTNSRLDDGSGMCVASSISDKSLTAVDSTTYLPPTPRVTPMSPTSPPTLSQSHHHLQQQHQLQQQQLHSQQQQQQQQPAVPGATMLPDDEQCAPHPAQLSELLARWVADAHIRTCLYSSEQIEDCKRKQTLDLSKVTFYKNMAHEELWFDCAQKLTTVIQQIIEFAKAVPGFRKFSQDDQIVLLKAGSFELAVLRMSRYYDVNQNCVVYGDTLLPMEAFLTTESAEMRLVNNVFEFSKTIAELKLTDTELGLYSALVLLQPDRSGLRGVDEIAKLSEAVGRSLMLELEKTHTPIKGDVTVFAFLRAKMPALRDLNQLHQDALSKFKRAMPDLQFSDLHKEIFNVDS